MEKRRGRWRREKSLRLLDFYGTFLNVYITESAQIDVSEFVQELSLPIDFTKTFQVPTVSGLNWYVEIEPVLSVKLFLAVGATIFQKVFVMEPYVS